MEITRLHVGPRLSEASIYNGVVYLAGQVADNVTQDIRGQTQEVLSMIDRLLAEANSHKSRILFCQIYLSDLGNFDRMNTIWEAWVEPGHTPPRATVQTKLARSDWLIEIVVVAAQWPAKLPTVASASPVKELSIKEKK